MAELLLEILSEEIPARMQARAAHDLKRLVTDKLKEARLAFKKADAYVTPRRLALVVDGLPVRTEDIREERRGPKADAPEQAVQGFCRGNGLDPADLEKRETPQGEYYFAVVEKAGSQAAEILPALVQSALAELPWPKSMRWSDRPERWVRPIQGLLALFEGTPLPLSVAGIEAAGTTQGHRFLAPGAFAVTSFADYKKKLKAAKVLLDPVVRSARIKKDAEALAAKAGLTLQPDEALLDEVTGLVEWPVALIGAIDAEFMDLPPEVMTTAMRSHQKYFAVLNASGGLAPNFITVANRTTKDKGKAVTAGNERVLRARLADARFYWDQDRRAPLRALVPALEDLVFHESLGTVAQKVWRMETLIPKLVEHIPGADRKEAVEAARLCKADLMSGMVGEFPELQGIMGRYYALKDGEPDSVADAIREHYQPQGPGDMCPTAPNSIAVAMADKIDMLVGFWAIDEKPTGSRDPYALRRAALGVIRLILENGVRIPLLELFAAAQNAYREKGLDNISTAAEELSTDLLSFFADRLKVHLREQGVRHDLIAAVFATGGEDDLVRLLARVRALEEFLDSDDGANLLIAHKRAANIVRIEEKRDQADYSYVDGFELPPSGEAAEKALFDRLMEVGPKITRTVDAEDYQHSMRLLASTRSDIDRFFDEVTVNVDNPDVRENRLKLLSFISISMNKVADFSQIEGGER